MKNADINGKRILEIGAFDNATFRIDAGDDVKYLDYFSREELFSAYKDNPRRNMSRLVDVDFVVKGPTFSEAVGGPYDLFVGNHVVEHVPDLVGWLNQIEKVLDADGYVFLAVPDKRFTFDYYKPITTWSDVVRAHKEKRVMPDSLTIATNRWYFTKVDTEALWRGEQAPAFSPKQPLSEILKSAELDAIEYVDSHCWVFTPDSFVTLLQDMKSADLTSLSVKKMEPTKVNSNEFWVVLGR